MGVIHDGVGQCRGEYKRDPSLRFGMTMGGVRYSGGLSLKRGDLR